MDLGIIGAGTRTRTEDLLITNQLLYQLSYAGQAGRAGAVIGGPEGSASTKAASTEFPILTHGFECIGPSSGHCIDGSNRFARRGV